MTEPARPDIPVNSEAYWEHRFATDWNARGGREQSRIFMELLVGFLPAEVHESIAAGGLSLLDCGCAKGDGTAVLAGSFPRSPVAGFDFSRTAIEEARASHPGLDFFVADFAGFERTADVLVSSNCLEHLSDAASVLRRMLSRARHYVLLLLPFLERYPKDSEHVRVVHASTFPERLEDWRLSHRIVVPPSPAWSQDQILLIYEPLARLGEGPLPPLPTPTDLDQPERLRELKASLETVAGGISSLEADLSRLRHELVQERAAVHQRAIEALERELGGMRRLADERAAAIERLRELADRSAAQAREREEHLRQVQARLSAEVEEREGRLRELAERLAEQERRCRAALDEARRQAELAASRETEAARLAGELAAVHGSRLWRVGHGYWSLLRRLRPRGTPPDAPLLAEPAPLAPPPEPAPEPLRSGLPPGAGYDVVCFPIIDWDFRFQRPQQLMLRLARRGHRVFYVAQRFRGEGDAYEVRRVAENVYEVSLAGPTRNVYTDPMDGETRDRLFAALDALRRDLELGATLAMVQLPFWWPLAERTWRELAWPIVYDCMDHHAGFSTNRPEMLGQERELLGAARLVLASSRALFDECRRGNENVLLLPNACEYEHFAAVGPPPGGGRPTIGYYGAIADWFDADLVADLAERRPDWDFVLVGSTYTADLSRLSRLANVELPGEQPYASLPGWIERFDALVLPFKRLPLTEATNPVKVYEILATGRPLVSVPLPEVVPMAPLVRLAGTAEELERELAAVLAGEEAELPERRRAFARRNTWEARLEVLAPRLVEAFPKASIVVVTFGNLTLNRLCLESLHERTEWPNFEVIAVDNGSTDGTVEYLAEAQKTWQRLHLVLNDDNAGFAAANNAGLGRADGDYLLLLNNDTVLCRGWLSTLIRHLHADPRLGLVGPVSNAVGNAAKVAVGYETVEQMPEWAARWVREHDRELAPIPMLAMFCLAMRREVYERVGALDERFEVGMFEDDDYSRRVRELGYEVACARDAFVHHWQKSSFRLLGESEYLRIFERNRRRYEEKWGAPWSAEGIDVFDDPLAAVLDRIRERRGVVVFLPSVGWGIHLFQRPHHLARTFAANGYVVVFDCTGSHDPVDGFEEIEPDLFLFRGHPDLLHRLPDPILWTFPYNFHLVDGYPPGTVTVYDWIDDLAVFPYDRETLEASHRRALAEATVVASVARPLDAQAKAARPDAVYLPNGVEYERFADDGVPFPDDPKLARFRREGKPIAGYYGALAEWLDYGLLDEAARRLPGWNFLLIGPMYDGGLSGKALLRRSNVVWTGPRDYRSLPGYLRLFDVATIPFKINEITLATSPLKLYEYFAGGKPVVAAPIPECEAFEEVWIASDVDGFCRALEEARRRGRDEGFRDRLRELARVSAWQARVDTVLAALAAAPFHAPFQRVRNEA